MENPKPELVLKHLEDVPKMGIVKWDKVYSDNWMIYLDIDNDFIWKALEVLRPFGYVYPWFTMGAHINIVTYAAKAFYP